MDRLIETVPRTVADEAVHTLEQIHARATALLGGDTSPLTAAATRATTALHHLAHALRHVQNLLAQQAAYHRGSTQPLGRIAAPSDNSHYPAPAAHYARRLPACTKPNGKRAKTVGYIMGIDYPPIVSGENDSHFDDTVSWLESNGLKHRRAMFLATHGS